MDSLLVGYLGVIVGFGLGVWAGHDMGLSALGAAGLPLLHWLLLFATRNEPPTFYIDGD